MKQFVLTCLKDVVWYWGNHPSGNNPIRALLFVINCRRDLKPVHGGCSWQDIKDEFRDARKERRELAEKRRFWRLMGAEGHGDSQ